MSVEYKIEAIKTCDSIEIARLADRLIGKGYYSAESIEHFAEVNRQLLLPISFVARNDAGRVIGFRLTVAPGRFHRQRKLPFSERLWGVNPRNVAYFKSLFIDPQVRRIGLGGALCSLALYNLQKSGAEAVVCHSTLGSPHQSSQRFLSKLGFQPVATHESCWSHVDYFCADCQRSHCECTGVEMILKLSAAEHTTNSSSIIHAQRCVGDMSYLCGQAE